MGKQGRRKQRQKRKQQQQPQVAQNVVNPASAIHQLRHPEPKTRHAALIAMQTTILHPDQTKKINLNVLQAIREQVMDSHLDCASTAAECLAQYLFLSSAKNDDDDDLQYKEATAGWALILIRRLDQCHKMILQLQQKEADKKKKQESSSAAISSTSNGGNQKPWYALAAPCFRALCKLVEGNELALEQVHNQIQTFLSTIFGLLQTSLISLEQATSAAPVDDRFVDWIRETTTFASRTLHSALDENETLACRIEKDMMVGLLPNNNNNNNDQQQSKLPELTRLHIIGSIVTLYQIEPTKWQSIILPNVVDTLTHNFLNVDTSELQNLENAYKEAKKLWQSQKEDDEMEQEIIQKVQTRREPARLIARRQKTTPRPPPSAAAAAAAAQQPGGEEGEDDTAMEDDGEQQSEEQPDGRQAMEDALIAWNHGVILPMQVALEVTANLLSCLIQDEDAMAIENDNTAAAGIEDQTLRNGLVAVKLTERCLQMLQVVCDYQQQLQQQQDGGGDNPNNDESSSSVLKQDLDDCISKISGCLVNCVLGQVVTSTEVMSSWQTLRRYANKNGVCSVMVVMTQRHPKLRDQLSQDVELFAGLLQIQDGTIQRDTVCLLTAAISSSSQQQQGSIPPPSAEVVSKVTTELLRLLKDGLTVGVKCEVLNGFMDLYGEDDYHPHVFDDLKVLAAIQQSLNLISSQTKKMQNKGGVSSLVLDPADEEILFNVNRFVDYKLGR